MMQILNFLNFNKTSKIVAAPARKTIKYIQTLAKLKPVLAIVFCPEDCLEKLRVSQCCVPQGLDRKHPVKLLNPWDNETIDVKTIATSKTGKRGEKNEDKSIFKLELLEFLLFPDIQYLCIV